MNQVIFKASLVTCIKLARYLVLLAALILSGLPLSGCGQSQDRFVIVTVIAFWDDIRLLRITEWINGMDAGIKERPADSSTFPLPLPIGARGVFGLQIEGLNPADCVASKGYAEINVNGESPYMLTVTLVPQSLGPGCDLMQAVMCPSQQTSCNGLCRTLSNDSINCGACGRACLANVACVAGECCTPPYRARTTGGQCVWNCGDGTQPDQTTNECRCKPGWKMSGTDSLGRRVCVVPPSLVLESPWDGQTVTLTVAFKWRIENPELRNTYRFRLLLDKGVGACDANIEESLDAGAGTSLTRTLDPVRYRGQKVEWGVETTDGTGKRLCMAGPVFRVSP